MTTAEFAALTKEAAFGRAVLEAAKTAGLVPRRAQVRTRIVQKIKVVTRRPRRTRAEIAASEQMLQTSGYSTTN